MIIIPPNLKKHCLYAGIVAFVIAILLFSTQARAVVLESGIPGVGAGGAQGQILPDLPTYINYLYIFVLSFVGIAGFVSLVIWGTVWVGSAVVDQKTRALEGIKNTLTGIAIALTAFIMLYTINPDLTIIKVPTIGGPVVLPPAQLKLIMQQRPRSVPDGLRCFSNNHCFVGSECSGVGSSSGICFRSSASLSSGKPGEPFCMKFDNNETMCLGGDGQDPSGCGWC